MLYTKITLEFKKGENNCTMNALYEIYLSIICGSYSEELQKEYSSDILSMALKHYTTPFICDYYMNNPCSLSNIKSQMKAIIGNYYLFEQFTQLIVTLLKSNNIRHFLMKGIYLSECYEQPDTRKQGDVDIYIPNKADIKTARKIFLENGFTLNDEFSSHHKEFIYNGTDGSKTLILELHYKVVDEYSYTPANNVIKKVFSEDSLSDYSIMVNGYTYNVFPPTENAFYMLHHMLNHYMYSGFGIRLLLDYKAFLTRYNSEIDYVLLKKWCSDSGILHFYEIVIHSLRLYLELDDTIDSDTHYDKKICEHFIEKVLTDCDFGTNTGNSLINSTSYKKITLLTYLKEGHHQMKMRFFKLHKVIILWPILWIITFACFIKNNKYVRNTSFSEVIDNFKTDNENIRMIKIFEDK